MMDNLCRYTRKFFNKCEVDSCSNIDKLCLDRALSRFLASGKKEDAFDVYFSFAEIFDIFGSGYEKNTKHLLELICEYEMNAGVLVKKQRDHYSHSVFVFAIGLSIYAQNKKFRALFKSHTRPFFNKISEEFLYRWGLCALFHDVGYPFEIVFEQIKTYTEGLNPDKGFYPLLSFRELDKFLSCGAIDIHKEIADKIATTLDLSVESVRESLDNIVPQSNKFMDHGYFGAIIMFKNLILRNDVELCKDVASSILIHNSFLMWKLKDVFARKFSPADYPLAFLLMLCDELQDYAREGYGQVSKNDNLAFAAEFIINENELKVVYVFDEKGVGTAEKRIRSKQEKMAFFDFDPIFSAVEISSEIREYDKKAKIYMSASFFKNIQRLAMQIHFFYLADKREGIQVRSWDDLPLEYKLANIAQAKSYSEKLNDLGYFYDDRNLHYDVVTELNEVQIERLAKQEHARWMEEKIGMGWKFGQPLNRQEREEKRISDCLTVYSHLSENEKDKDRDAVKHMLENLKAAGFKVYKLK